MNIHLHRYHKLITHYKTHIESGFVEKHHILPKCMGGNNSIDNLILLPVRAHYIAHYFLHKAYPNNNKLSLAFAMMIVNNRSQNRKMSSRFYEIAKTARSSALKGVPRTEDIKQKLRVPKKNKENYKGVKSTEHKNNISKALKGKTKTKEHIQNMINSQKNYQKIRMGETIDRINLYKTKFIESGLTKSEFYKIHTEFSKSTICRYLKEL